jgi:XTP/dITP diphosphohydrolase
MTLLIATTNAGKLAEITSLLDGLPTRLVSLAECPGIPEPVETGATFAEIARNKARYYSVASGLLTVADDSGLLIDALDGAPGIHSARFPGLTYEDKFAGLFAMMDARNAHTSAARFVCAAAVAQGEAILFEGTGTVEGEIVREPRGTHGFGYDPIFFYPPMNRTLAEVSGADKSSVSHRGHAFRAVRGFLEKRFPLVR